MSFYASEFTYDGISCRQFGLMMYEMSDYVHEGNGFAGVATVEEEWMVTKYKPVFYGVKFENKLEFSIVFGLDCDRLDAGDYLTHNEMDDIATWLIGHDGYKYLQILQDDLKSRRFRCIVSALEPIMSGQQAVAMQATFICDGPYAYRMPAYVEYKLNGAMLVQFDNASSHHGYYRPVIEYYPNSGGNLSIINQTDNGRETKFESIPASVTQLSLDNDTMIIKSNTDLNLYDCFNKKSLRFKQGENQLALNGNGTLRIRYEFPMNISG